MTVDGKIELSMVLRSFAAQDPGSWAHVVRQAETFDRADPHLQFDAVVAATAEVLRDSPYAGRYGLADIRDIVERDGLRLPRTDEVHDFLQLLDDLAARER